MPIAFKEWAVTVRALAEGEQLVTLRKGGIREPDKHFALEHDRFFLYPTFDHQRNDLVRESHQPELRRALEEGVWAGRRAARPRADAWTAGSPSPTACASAPGPRSPARGRSPTAARVDALSPFYVWTPDYAEKRLAWKRRHPLHVLLLRTYRIPRPVTVRVRDDYGGCRSWLEITRDLPFEGTPGALRRGVRARLRGDRGHRRRRRRPRLRLGPESERRGRRRDSLASGPSSIARRSAARSGVPRRSCVSGSPASPSPPPSPCSPPRRPRTPSCRACRRSPRAAAAAAARRLAGTNTPVEPYGANDGGGFRDILPPGTRGRYNAAAAGRRSSPPARPSRTAATSSACTGDLCTRRPGCSASQIAAATSRTRRSACAPDDAERTYSPRADVTIVRDKGFGVPHVYGTTRDGAMFGARLRGRRGPPVLHGRAAPRRPRRAVELRRRRRTQAMDAEQWQVAPYTEADLSARSTSCRSSSARRAR